MLLLDEAPVEACLEYLTRPHHSWDSASKVVQMQRERVAQHEASVLARSFAFSRRGSMLSSFSATTDTTGVAGLMNTSFASVSSVASAPAGFPRSAQNGSKTQVGTLRKSGRLAGTSPAPAALVGQEKGGAEDAFTSCPALDAPRSSCSGTKADVAHPPRRVGGSLRGHLVPKGSVVGGRTLPTITRSDSKGAKRSGKGKTRPAEPSSSASLDLVVGGRALSDFGGTNRSLAPKAPESAQRTLALSAVGSAAMGAGKRPSAPTAGAGTGTCAGGKLATR